MRSIQTRKRLAALIFAALAALWATSAPRGAAAQVAQVSTSTPTTAAVQPGAADATDSVVAEAVNGAAGGANVVQVRNSMDGRLRFGAKSQVSRVNGLQMEAANVALAYASCANCQTYAVALQIVLYSSGARVVAPQNAAVALNAGCSGCYTVARAIQYAIPVGDSTQIPDRVTQMDQQFNQQLRDIAQASGTLTVADVDARLDAVIGEFQDLGGYLLERRSVQQDVPAATPTPTTVASAQPTETLATVPTATATATPLPSATPPPASTAPVS